jgi:hypothetical protein
MKTGEVKKNRKPKQVVVKRRLKEALKQDASPLPGEQVRHVTFRLPMDIVAQIESFCSENDETLSQFYRKAIKQRLKDEVVVGQGGNK